MFWKHRVTVSAACGVFATIGLLAGCSSTGPNSSANSTTSGKSTLAADVAFYKGQTIRWVIDSTPGTSLYDEAEILAPHIGDYLDATVDVVPMPAGAGIPGQDYVADASPNGLTIGTLNSGTDLIDPLMGLPSISFKMQDEAIIAAEGASPVVFVACHGSPFTTFSQALSYKKVFNAITFQGATNAGQEILYGGYGAESHFVSGYASQAAAAAGCLRGDGYTDFNAVASAGIASAISAGQIRPLLMGGPIAAGSTDYSILSKVPTIAQYVAEYPPPAKDRPAVDAISKLWNGDPNDIYFAPKGTSSNRIAALTAAFKAAMAMPSVRKEELTGGFSTTYITPASAYKLLTSAVQGLAAGKALLSYDK